MKLMKVLNGLSLIFSMCSITGCQSTTLSNNFTPNNPPSDLRIEGPKRGYVGIVYEFFVSAIDLNGDDLQYAIDWDNDNFLEGFTQPALSGQQVSIKNSWAKPGTYSFSAIAVDPYRATSAKATHKIEIYRQPLPTTPLMPLIK